MPLGVIVGAHGVRGAVRVHSWTRPPEAILDYPAWWLGEKRTRYEIRAAQPTSRGLRVQLTGVEDRDQAERLARVEVCVPRSALPEPAPNEVYWADLEGLAVETLEGDVLGSVSHLIETGANDVLVVQGERERLIPFVRERVVREIDLAGGRVVVDWDPDWDLERQD